MSASVLRTSPSFCIWLLLTALVLVLDHGLLFSDGSALGILMRPVMCYKVCFVSDLVVFVEGDPSESAFPLTAQVDIPPRWALSTQNSSCSAGATCMGLFTYPAQRKSLSQRADLSISLLPRPGSWRCLMPLVVVNPKAIGKGGTI